MNVKLVANLMINDISELGTYSTKFNGFMDNFFCRRAVVLRSFFSTASSCRFLSNDENAFSPVICEGVWAGKYLTPTT